MTEQRSAKVDREKVRSLCRKSCQAVQPWETWGRSGRAAAVSRAHASTPAERRRAAAAPSDAATAITLTSLHPLEPARALEAAAAAAAPPLCAQGGGQSAQAPLEASACSRLAGADEMGARSAERAGDGGRRPRAQLSRIPGALRARFVMSRSVRGRRLFVCCGRSNRDLEHARSATPKRSRLQTWLRWWRCCTGSRVGCGAGLRACSLQALAIPGLERPAPRASARDSLCGP